MALQSIGIDKEYRMPSQSDGMASPHVVGGRPPFDWVVEERGVEISRRCGLDADTLAFVILDDVIRDHAMQLELRTRGETGYSRASWANAHIALMARIDPAWGLRVAAHYEEVFRTSPLSPAESRATRDLGTGQPPGVRVF